MLEYRQSMVIAMSQRPLVIQRGPPPAEVLAYQDFILSTFCQTGSRVSERQLLLKKVCTGDWRREDCLEVYLPIGFTIDETSVKDTVMKVLIYCLCRKVYALYPRHRWFGSDAATDQVGLRVALYGLGQEAFRLMCASSDRNRQAAPSGESLFQGSGAEPCTKAMMPGTDVDVIPDTEHGQPAAAPSGAPSEPPDSAGLITDEASASWQAKAASNAQNRRKALDWFARDPFAEVLMLRLLMEPMCTLMEAYLQRSGQKWVEAQNLAHLQTSAGQQPKHHPTSDIEERLASTAEKRLLEDLYTLVNSEEWQWLPDHSMTLAQQALVFRTSSRLGCLVHQLLVHPSQLCPVLAFGLLNRPAETAAELQDLPPCMLDSFTTALLHRFPGEQLVSAESLACLRVIAHCLHCETVQIEWGHGRFHRIISHGCIQTHCPHMKYVNAQFVGQKFGSRQQRACVGKGAGLKRKRGKEGQHAGGRAKGHQKRGTGGAWRAFVHLTSKGIQGKSNLAQLARRFRAEREAQTPLFLQAQAKGELATKRSKLGQRGFGPSLHKSGKTKRVPTKGVSMIRAISGNFP